MQEYRFGGSQIKRIKSKILSNAAKAGCGVSTGFVRIAKKLNSSMVRMRLRANKLLIDSEPITIHITRIVPLDRWTLRIEFTVNRKTKHCIHHTSPNGGYSEIFSKFKRGEEVEISEPHYYMVAAGVATWKLMKTIN